MMKHFAFVIRHLCLKPYLCCGKMQVFTIMRQTATAKINSPVAACAPPVFGQFDMPPAQHTALPENSCHHALQYICAYGLSQLAPCIPAHAGHTLTVLNLKTAGFLIQPRCKMQRLNLPAVIQFHRIHAMLPHTWKQAMADMIPHQGGIPVTRIFQPGHARLP